MKLLVLLVGFIVVQASDYEQWQDFKVKFSKSHSLTEDKLRFEIFQNNLRRIEKHNAMYEKGEVSYFMKITQFADWTLEEYKSMLGAQLNGEPKFNPIGTFKPEVNFTRPESIDWRQKGAVLAVKTQGQCGSCWAFSTTGALEGQLAIHRNQYIPLSEQELVSCDENNRACKGGWIDVPYTYIKQNGLSSEEQYPYTGNESSCINNITNKPLTTVQGFISIEKDEESMADAVATVGPISIYVNAIANWQLYGGGIFDDKDCVHDFNHAVIITGYDYQSWTIKNSWGTEWGEEGYMRLIRGKSQCGITILPIYPVL
ncbi:cathepsin L-like proteinase [Diorhabda sublineata]|uniref:cathepsin L-like proteinase n=1 Tax=Diorhabda sublineata TaxID=1163346 RepID=UPI0024E0EB8F|nr:cathepsin L-like proteinase [Diorhabda sublineata]